MQQGRRAINDAIAGLRSLGFLVACFSHTNHRHGTAAGRRGDHLVKADEGSHRDKDEGQGGGEALPVIAISGRSGASRLRGGGRGGGRGSLGAPGGGRVGHGNGALSRRAAGRRGGAGGGAGRRRRAGGGTGTAGALEGELLAKVGHPGRIRNPEGVGIRRQSGWGGPEERIGRVAGVNGNDRLQAGGRPVHELDGHGSHGARPRHVEGRASHNVELAVGEGGHGVDEGGHGAHESEDGELHDDDNTMRSVDAEACKPMVVLMALGLARK